MKPPPAIAKIPPMTQRAVNIKQTIARIVTPTGLFIRSSSLSFLVRCGYCTRTLLNSNRQIFIGFNGESSHFPEKRRLAHHFRGFLLLRLQPEEVAVIVRQVEFTRLVLAERTNGEPGGQERSALPRIRGYFSKRPRLPHQIAKDIKTLQPRDG